MNAFVLGLIRKLHVRRTMNVQESIRVRRVEYPVPQIRQTITRWLTRLYTVIFV